MVELVFDVLEEILKRLDVKDLIRCKSVCKSWLSFISTPRFVKAHLNHNIKSDRDNRQLRNRRIHDGSSEGIAVCLNLHCIVGSCNGLVCVSPQDAEFLVTNPSTRQQKILQTLPNGFNRKDMVRFFICRGFGYDSTSDDYKVVAGLRNDRDTKRTTFHVLTLKSNTWKVIGESKYQYLARKRGILCDGALNWFMTNRNCNKIIIISLDLSTEELKKIPQPDDADYKKSLFFEHRLGVIQDRLCIYSNRSSKIWVMVNKKWELYIDRQQSKYDVAHCLSRVGDSQNKRGDVYRFIHDDGQYDGYRVPCNGNYISSSIFVKSLVSPHFQVDRKQLKTFH